MPPLHGPSAHIKDELRSVCGSPVYYSSPHSALSQGRVLHSPQTDWNLLMSSSTQSCSFIPGQHSWHQHNDHSCYSHVRDAQFWCIQNVCVFLTVVGFRDFLQLLLHITCIHFDRVSLFLIDVKAPSVSSWPLQKKKIRQESTVRSLRFSPHKCASCRVPGNMQSVCVCVERYVCVCVLNRHYVRALWLAVVPCWRPRYT